MSRKKQTKKRTQPTAEKRAAKKAAVLGTERKNRVPIFVVIAVLAVVVAGGVFFMTRKGQERALPVGSVSSEATASRIMHPVSLFDDGRARHFQYAAGDGITVKYFVLKSSDGVIRAAFDACDVCWKAGKGYVQQGDYMVCVNCGRKFESVLVNVVKGGCNPAPLNRAIEEGHVVISVEDIQAGRRYFDFSRGVSS